MRARLESLLAVALIGDGVLAALQPRRHMARWDAGPEAWRKLVRPFRERPALTRSLALGQTLAAAAWASRIAPRRA